MDELSKTTTNAYDSLGRLTSITNRTSDVTSFSYDAMSRVTRETDDLGNQTDTAYNNRGWISSITYPDPDGAGSLARPVDTRSYIATGQTSGNGEASNNYNSSRGYTYDADGRLTSKSDPAQA